MASQTLCWHPKGISDGHFAIVMNKYARIAIEDFSNKVDYRTNAHKRRLEMMKGKSQIAIDMVKRAVNSGIYADYLLVDSWYSRKTQNCFYQEQR